MDELKIMMDHELAQRIQQYRSRLDRLMFMVSQYMQDGIGEQSEIRAEYKCLKEEIRADAHYVDLSVNRKGRARCYHDIARAISEAAAFGFTAPINSRIDQKFFSSIEEAHYKLGKCYPEKILEGASK